MKEVIVSIVDSYIENKLREIKSYINDKYAYLYEDVYDNKMQIMFSTLHNLLIVNFKEMNSKLPTKNDTAHFWAESSRNLLFAIDTICEVQQNLEESDLSFDIDDYYKNLIEKAKGFLNSTNGSEIPSNMNKVNLYCTKPIFIKRDSISLNHIGKQSHSDLKLIGEGSYAKVFSYYDPVYDRKFVLKRAFDDLTDKEVKRFKQEFIQMHSLNSPYIVEVFKYDDKNKEYTMEFMDCSLFDYINKNNSSLTMEYKKSIIIQILRAFKYIHSKGLLHRDISPKNILLKKYDDVLVVKVSDFGLVKVPDSNLTTFNTEFKGWFNDTELRTEGFVNYKIIHETYALTRLIYYVLTGETNISQIKKENLRNFVYKGLSSEQSKRYKSVDEIIAAIREYNIFR